MIRQLTTLSLLALVAGCAIQKAEQPKPAFDSSRNPDWLSPDLYPNGAVAEKEPVVRYGRYTLVSTQPETGQRDLMAQIIDVTIPANMKPSLHDAMEHVIDRSGYSLCPRETDRVNILYTRPLPAAQYKLGPMTLRNTLQVLAGPAWQVKVDEVNRQVCFVLRPGYQLPTPSAPTGQLYADKARAPATSSATLATTPSVVVAAVPAPAPISTTTPAVAIPTPVAPVLPPVGPAKDGALPTSSSVVSATKPSSSSVTGKTVSSKSAPPPGQAKTTSVVSTPMPLTVPPPTPVIAPRPLPQIWTADTGSTLRQSVEAWAKKANPVWQVIWGQEDLDYPIQAQLRFEGSFEQAISELFPLYDSAPRSFIVDGNNSQRVLHVDERKKK